MRKTFFKELTELARKDKRIWLLTADLLCFSEDFPKDRFINVGIAEQNMIGVASGLAMCGKIPFCYSMSTFLIFRAYEFIRNNIAYENLPVRLVGCAGPYPYYGISHNCENKEDINLIKTLPNFSVYAFDNCCEEEHQYLKAVLKEDYSKPYPIYFRLTR